MILPITLSLRPIAHMGYETFTQSIQEMDHVLMYELIPAIESINNGNSTKEDIEIAENYICSMINPYMGLYEHKPVVRYLYGDDPRGPLLDIWTKVSNGMVEIQMLLPQYTGDAVAKRDLINNRSNTLNEILFDLGTINEKLW